MGKRNLEKAIQSVAHHTDVEVRWHPFFLRHNIPLEGVAKAPATPDNPRVGARMKAAGAAVGIDFTGKTDRYPNTIMAHRLLTYAERAGPKMQNRVQEVLFRGYFTDGVYPDVDGCSAMAAECGMDRDAVRRYLESDQDRQSVVAQAEAASRAGITGVPFFVVDGAPMGSGAQPPEAFVEQFSRQQAPGREERRSQLAQQLGW